MISQREKKIEEASILSAAKSELAKFVFDPGNHEKFKPLFAIKSPKTLVKELNEKKISQSDLEQFKKIISKQGEYIDLFALPPNQWLDILLNDGIQDADLQELFGKKGLVRQVLTAINTLPDPYEKTQLLHYLASTPDISGKEIVHYLQSKKLLTPYEANLKNAFLRLHQLLREDPKVHGVATTSIELLLKKINPQNIEKRINATQNLMRECIMNARNNEILKLIAAHAKEAKSALAKFVFDANNIEKIGALFTIKPPNELIADLNKQNISNELLNQLNILSSNQKEYSYLFKLSPDKWFSILTQEKTEAEDLIALIGSPEYVEGAITCILSEINELPEMLDRARAFNYILNSKSETDLQIQDFVYTLQLPAQSLEQFKINFLHLHHILHNVREPVVHEGPFQSVLARPATAGILRINPPEPPSDDLKPDERALTEKKNKETVKKNEARIKAALRIMKECVNYLLDRTVAKLTQEELRNFQDEQSELYARQLDEEMAKELNQQEHGELSARSIPETKRSADFTRIFLSHRITPTDMMLMSRFLRNSMIPETTPFEELSRNTVWPVRDEENSPEIKLNPLPHPIASPSRLPSSLYHSLHHPLPLQNQSSLRLVDTNQLNEQKQPQETTAPGAPENKNAFSFRTILRSLPQSPLSQTQENKQEIKQRAAESKESYDYSFVSEDLLSQQEAILRSIKESKPPEQKIPDGFEVIVVDGQRLMRHK